MNRILVGGLVGLGMIISMCAANFCFAQDDARRQLYEKETANMFIDSDTDEFNPGPGIGQAFPQIDAFYQGRRISSTLEFAGRRGTVFFANRSVDW